MAYNPAPSSFFGAAYALAANAISFPTATGTTGTTVGTTFVGSAATNLLTTATAHGLLVGDRVRVVAGTGALPTGLSAATDYWVAAVPSTTTLSLAATEGGAVIDITVDGGTDHLLKSMGPLDELSDTNANATTGDWRKVIYSFMAMLYKKWTNTAAADRPSNIVIARSSSINNTTQTITYAYTVRVTMAYTGAVEVADE